MNESFDNTTIGVIVANDYRTARVFEHFGIDFCCGGQRSTIEACRAAGVDAETVKQALEALPPVDQHDDTNVAAWPPDRLIDHILATHHVYVRSAVPAIGGYLAKLVQVHAERHPELIRVREVFDGMGRGLMEHMVKEEMVLFPYIRKLASRQVAAPSRGTVESPIRAMEAEHRQAGNEMRLIRELTGDLTLPPDGCATYRACFEELAAFEQDLHRHIHLENNVLFPEAIEIERRQRSV